MKEIHGHRNDVTEVKDVPELFEDMPVLAREQMQFRKLGAGRWLQYGPMEYDSADHISSDGFEQVEGTVSVASDQPDSVLSEAEGCEEEESVGSMAEGIDSGIDEESESEQDEDSGDDSESSDEEALEPSVDEEIDDSDDESEEIKEIDTSIGDELAALNSGEYVETRGDAPILPSSLVAGGMYHTQKLDILKMYVLGNKPFKIMKRF